MEATSNSGRNSIKGSIGVNYSRDFINHGLTLEVHDRRYGRRGPKDSSYYESGTDIGTKEQYFGDQCNTQNLVMSQDVMNISIKHNPLLSLQKRMVRHKTNPKRYYKRKSTI